MPKEKVKLNEAAIWIMMNPIKFFYSALDMFIFLMDDVQSVPVEKYLDFMLFFNTHDQNSEKNLIWLCKSMYN